MIETPVQSDSHQLAAEIKQRARRLGFDLVGIAPAEPSKYADYLREWIRNGKAGEMSYLVRRVDERVDPATYLPGARSVICVAINYHVPLEPLNSQLVANHGRIARYALGDDYHDLIKARLRALADWIRELKPDATTRACVDTAPVMEKELAARAGIGWFGKNSCVINEGIGSWLLLGEIITTLDLPPDEPAIDRCGTCRRCIDACPTGAITAPYQLDARKCISYLTIEHRSPIADELKPAIGNWIYGCDICQDVCPWNSDALTATDPARQPRFATGTLDVREISTWTDDDYRTNLRGSAMKRVKLPILKRNAAIVAGNLLRMLSVVTILISCISCKGISGHREGPVNHLVVCWLKTPGDAKGREELIEASKSFEETIPGIVKVSAGTALPSTRPVVDSSFDVAIVMIFRDEASLRAFEHHPVHMQAVEKTLKPHVARFVVYDFVDDE